MKEKVVKELGVEVNLASDHLTPERTVSFYNPKMCKNRMLVLCALTAAKTETKRTQTGSDRRMTCLDAFGATGIMGLQWVKHHPSNISVTISDTNPASVANIRRNCALNNIHVSESQMQESAVEQNVEMLERTKETRRDLHESAREEQRMDTASENAKDIKSLRTEVFEESNDQMQTLSDKARCGICESETEQERLDTGQEDDGTAEKKKVIKTSLQKEPDGVQIVVEANKKKVEAETHHLSTGKLETLVKQNVQTAEENEVGTEVSQCHLTRLEQQGDDADGKTGESIPSTSRQRVTVLCSDAHLVMRQRYFDFIHLDPYGCATPFMDSAFSNVSNHGIVSITSTDTSALYGKCPQVTLRNYGGRVAKCEYLRELSARLIIASAARAAARCNKGVEALLCVALEHFVLVILRVRRGAGQADRSVGMVKHLIHCQMCGQRCFVPNTLSVPNSLYLYLGCDCQQKAPGKTAVLLGPVWSGDIYDIEFVGKMEEEGKKLGLGKKDLQLLHSLQEEAICSGDPKYGDAGSNPDDERVTAHTSQGVGSQDGSPENGQHGKPKRASPAVDEESSVKMAPERRKCKQENLTGNPAFFFSIPRYSVKDMNCPRINTLVECLQQKGFRASRTHFDPEGVRTNAGLADFQAVLKANSTPTKK